MSVSYPFWRGNLKKRCHTKAFKIQNDPTRSASLIDLFGLGRVIHVFAAESSSEIAPHKQRNKRDDKETAG